MQPAQKKFWMGLFRMVTSSKWITLLIAVLIAAGLDISPELMAFIVMSAAGIYAAATAFEDAGKPRS